MNCIDCKYFKSINYKNYNSHIGVTKDLQDKGYGHCSCDKIAYGMTGPHYVVENKVLVKGPDGNYLIKQASDDELRYEDNECYAADLIVGPNFGCKHFTEKEVV